MEVVPRRFTGALLTPLLEQGDEADVTVVRVVVRGERQGKRASWTFEMVHFYDAENRVTSMARTTGYKFNPGWNASARSDQRAGGRPPGEGVRGRRDV